MKASISLTTADLRQLVLHRIGELLPNIAVDPSQVRIEVKTKANYRAEWEDGEFRATIDINQQEL